MICSNTLHATHVFHPPHSGTNLYPGELEALEARVDKWGKRFHQAKCQIMEM